MYLLTYGLPEAGVVTDGDPHVAPDHGVSAPVQDVQHPLLHVHSPLPPCLRVNGHGPGPLPVQVHQANLQSRHILKPELPAGPLGDGCHGHNVSDLPDVNRDCVTLFV